MREGLFFEEADFRILRNIGFFNENLTLLILFCGAHG
jgi:hypothetical protein